MLPRHVRCVLSRFCCNEHCQLLSSYLSRIRRIENSSSSDCGHPSQDTSHLILLCPATNSLRRSLFGDSISLRPMVQALGSFPASGAPWSSAMTPSLGRGRVTTTPTTSSATFQCRCLSHSFCSQRCGFIKLAEKVSFSSKSTR